MKFLLTLAVALCLFYGKQVAGVLSNNDLKQLAELDDQEHYKNALANILVPRVVGSDGWKNVQNFIISELKSFGMQVELDSFEDTAPIFGKLNFVNIIGRLNPNADRFLVLSAHYDSKYFKNGNFVGATDSAVPCALMLNIVKTTLPYLKKILEGKNLGLMLIFFDGEEAFENWSDTDSLYGSRHLAAKWEKQKNKNEREIDRINVLVLLDLIGATSASFKCSFINTCNFNQRLSDIESKLKETSSLKKVRNAPSSMFTKNFWPSGVSDDHVPFLKRDVPILHLIPTNFPEHWHKLTDDAAHLNQNSILNFNRVMRTWVIEYLVDCTNLPQSSNCRLKFNGGPNYKN